MDQALEPKVCHGMGLIVEYSLSRLTCLSVSNHERFKSLRLAILALLGVLPDSTGFMGHR